MARCICLVLLASLQVLNVAMGASVLPKWPSNLPRNFTFSTLLIKPYAMLKKDSSGEDDKYQGFIIDLMKRIAAEYGVRAHVRIADGVGERQAGGGWTGMLGDITSGTSLVGGPSEASSVSDAVDFTRPFLNRILVTLSKRPARHRGWESRYRTAADLYRSGTPYGVVKGSDAERMIKISTNPLFKKMWQKMASSRKSLISDSYDVAVTRVLAGNYSIITESDLADYYMNSNPCKLVVSRNILPSYFGNRFAVPTGSKVAGLINKALLTLLEDGEIHDLYRKWWPSSNDHEACDV